MMFVVMGIGCASSVASFLYWTQGYFLSCESTISLNDILYPILVTVIPVVNGLIFFSIIPGYIIYQVYKVIKTCHRYHRRNNPVAISDQEEAYLPLNNDWSADRMENPQQHNERSVSVTSDDLLPENKQPVITTAVEELKRPLLDTQI